MKRIKGFLSKEEGKKLQEIFKKVHTLGPVLEVGTYCGKSALCFAKIAKDFDSTVFTVDHHTGSEEHQLGEEYHDKDLYDNRLHKFNTLPELLSNLIGTGLGSYIIPIVNDSVSSSKNFKKDVSVLFIDGGHSLQAAINDYDAWKDKIAIGGYLLIHDVFPNPADGGRPPFEIYNLAKKSGKFEDLGIFKTLAMLKKTPD